MLLNKKREAFLEKLLITPSPSGFEMAGQQIWLDYVKEYADRTETDAYGSATAHIDTDPSAMTVMIEAHCDEIGMIVRYIDASGYVYVDRLGGSDPSIAKARKVFIHNQEGTVSGVIGTASIHLHKGDLKKLKWKDIYIDIGACNKEEAMGMIKIGDPVTFAENFEYISDDRITGRAIDNRAGSFIIACVMENLLKKRAELKVNVIALNAVQEEIGGFGARMMSYRNEPDLALITDVTHATDTPDIDPKEHGLVELARGPVINHGAGNHSGVMRYVETVAEEKGISIQHESDGYRTGTDMDAIYHQKKGIPSGLISLPLRYMHSPVETASISDIIQLIELLTTCILKMNKNEQFELFRIA